MHEHDRCTTIAETGGRVRVPELMSRSLAAVSWVETATSSTPETLVTDRDHWPRSRGLKLHPRIETTHRARGIPCRLWSRSLSAVVRIETPKRRSPCCASAACRDRCPRSCGLKHQDQAPQPCQGQRRDRCPRSCGLKRGSRLVWQRRGSGHDRCPRSRGLKRILVCVRPLSTRVCRDRCQRSRGLKRLREREPPLRTEVSQSWSAVARVETSVRSWRRSRSSRSRTLSAVARVETKSHARRTRSRSLFATIARVEMLTRRRYSGVFSTRRDRCPRSRGLKRDRHAHELLARVAIAVRGRAG